MCKHLRTKEYLLLIDDGKPDAIFFKRILEKEGCPTDVTRYGEAEAALAHLKKGLSGYLLLLPDIRMPKMTGPELPLKLNSRGMLNQRPPIIVYSFSNVRKNIEQAGVHPGVYYQTELAGYPEGKAWPGTIIDQLNLEKLPE